SNAAKAAIPWTAAAREDCSSWQGLGLVIKPRSIGEWQRVQVRNRRPQRIGDDLIALPEGYSFQAAPVASCFECIEQLDQGGLALEPDHRIKPGHSAQDLFVVKARVMAAGCYVGGDVVLSEGADDFGEVGRHVLEDQRESDHVRILAARGFD